MSAKSNNFKIGLFVLAGVVVFVLGLLAFGARGFFEPKIRFESCVTGDVEGLSVGSVVKFRGVPIGKVTRIDFTWNVYPESTNSYVVIEFEVNTRIGGPTQTRDTRAFIASAVQRGLRARVKGQGITGVSIVSLENLDPAQNPPPAIDFRPRHVYIPSARSQFGQILASIEGSLRNIQNLDIVQIGQRVEKVLNSLDGLVTNISQVNFGEVGRRAQDRLAEFKSTNERLQGLLDDLRATVARAKVDVAVTNANGLIADLGRTNQKLQSFLDDLRGLDLGPLNETLANTRTATDELGKVLRDLKEYPSGFLFGQPPPPARSVETRRK